MPKAKFPASRGRVAEVIACLMKGPRSVEEIMEMTDVAKATCRAWLSAFRGAGLVRISAYRHRASVARGGRRVIVYEWQAIPYAREDVENVTRASIGKKRRVAQ